MTDLAGEIDDLVNHPRWQPYNGWANTGRMAAFQQVRYEFLRFVDVLHEHLSPFSSRSTSCLQLGVGLSDCSHDVWGLIFHRTVTIDFRACYLNREMTLPGYDTHSHEAKTYADNHGPYDLLFIDAGHVYEDVKQDYDDYNGFVRPGGIVAFHDAIHRPQYDSDHHVWRYLEEHHPGINIIGSDVGIAWYLKEE